MQQTTRSERVSQRVPLRSATSQGGIAFQLSASHVLAGAVALGIFFWMTQLHLPQPYTLLIALTAAAATGLLCTLNLQYSLYLLELTLVRLAHGLPVPPISEDDYKKIFMRRWPLGPLFLRLQEANQRIQHYVEQASLTTDLREKALQQASETAAQAERNRIARELHDSIKQQIFSISVSAAAAKAHWQGEASEDAREAVADIQRSAQEAQVEMQALLQQLRPAPLENTSLLEALKVQAQALGFRTGAQVQVEIGEVPGNDRLLPGTQETIFRLVQEAFANIARHARADHAWLKLRVEEQALRITVRDNGQGFALDQARKGMGLNNLGERTRELHGSVEINSQPGQGTTVEISIPLLEALRSPAEEARQQYALARSYELSKRGYQLCENTARLGIALVALASLLSIHWSVIVLAALITIYGYASGVYSRIQVALHTGSGSRETLELRLSEYKAGLNLARLLALCAWYAFALAGFLQTDVGWWLLAGIVACLIGFVQIARRQRLLNIERYYRLLLIQELRLEIEMRRQALVRSGMTWAMIGVIGLAVYHRLLVFPPLTIGQRTAYGLGIVLLLMSVSFILEYLQVQRWRQTPGKSEQSASTEEA